MLLNIAIEYFMYLLILYMFNIVCIIEYRYRMLIILNNILYV